MNLLIEALQESMTALFLASPFLLLGLGIAGLLQVLLPPTLIARWMGRPGLSGVVWAALVGVPLPVCSCGVVPITVELRRQGASVPSSLSFLTTTPESSVDSILMTWGLMGPVMAVARPIAALGTALLGGVLAIWFPPPDCEVRAQGASCDAGHSHGRPAAAAEGAAKTVRMRLRRPWRDLLRPALRHGFVDLFDDLAFWLLIGIGAAGVLAAVLPDDLGALGLGWLAMVPVLAISIPLYMCASASTPIAAALMAKGLGPGPALVFLLAGPATNVATVILLSRTFGRRFVSLYLISVIAGALGAGVLLELLLARALTMAPIPLVAEGGEGLPAWGWPFFVAMVLLLAWRLAAGAWSQGVRELKEAMTSLRPRMKNPR